MHTAPGFSMVIRQLVFRKLNTKNIAIHAHASFYTCSHLYVKMNMCYNNYNSVVGIRSALSKSLSLSSLIYNGA